MTQLEKDKFYMEFAKLAATKSKDPRTKVGSCIVNDDNVPLKENKNSYMIHSELNSILNYGGSLKDLEGATMYCTISPCHECAKIIIQAGIKRVVFLEEYHRTEMVEMTKLLFKLSGVKYEKLREE